MIIKSGEKLLHKNLYVEKADWEIFEQYAKLTNQSVSSVVRKLMSVNVSQLMNKLIVIDKCQ